MCMLSSGPIVVMILEGNDAVIANRKLMGATDPKDAEDNTIRKKYGISIDKNSVHGSDSKDNAKKEIDFFLKINYILKILIIASGKALYSRFLSFSFQNFFHYLNHLYKSFFL